MFFPVVAKYPRFITYDAATGGKCWRLKVSHITKQKGHYPPGKTTMLSTYKNVLVSGPNCLLTTSADDLTL